MVVLSLIREIPLSRLDALTEKPEYPSCHLMNVNCNIGGELRSIEFFLKRFFCRVRTSVLSSLRDENDLYARYPAVRCATAG